MGSIECLARIIDSWRDSAGTLWALNAFAPLDLPARKLGAAVNQSWIIGNVDFVRNDERGTVADLMLMPKEAFLLQPEILRPWNWNPNEGLPPAARGEATNNPAPPPAAGSTPTAGTEPAPAATPPGRQARPPAGGGAALGAEGILLSRKYVRAVNSVALKARTREDQPWVSRVRLVSVSPPRPC
jgi:hypothetical protein